MARKGDKGPYSLDNIYCAFAEQNVADMSPLQPVITPSGRFKDVLEAAYRHGIAVKTARDYARQGRYGWHYPLSLQIKKRGRKAT